MTESEHFDELGDLYSRNERSFKNRYLNAVKLVAESAYNTFKVEDWSGEQGKKIDETMLREFMSKWILSVYMLVATNCFRIYTELVGKDTKESHFERKRYEKIKAGIDEDTYAQKSIGHSARKFRGLWLQYIGSNEAEKIAANAIEYLSKRILLKIFFSEECMRTNSPIALDDAEYAENALYQVRRAFELFYVVFVDLKAEALIKHLNPAKMPLEELRVWAGVTWLEEQIFGDGHRGPTLTHSLDSRTMSGTVYSLSMQPVQAVDRAARRLFKWDINNEDAPVFTDPNSRHKVTYYEEGLSLEMTHKAVKEMSVRTADVWRLTTASILEHWHEGESEPPRVWIDARTLCDAMGYVKHSHGGHRPENIATVVAALRDLERMHVEIALKSTEYPENRARGKRSQTLVTVRRMSRVILVTDIEEEKVLVDNEYLPLRWKITAGDWIKNYPRGQFAPLFRSLVGLPGRNKTDIWTKALGTELTWQYRQDEGKTQVQYVRTMLKQSGILEQAYAEKNKRRVKDDFDKAMERLQNYGVCEFWDYDSDDESRLNYKSRGWFDEWLKVRVEVVPPQIVAQAMKELAGKKFKHRTKRPFHSAKRLELKPSE